MKILILDYFDRRWVQFINIIYHKNIKYTSNSKYIINTLLQLTFSSSDSLDIIYGKFMFLIYN